MAGLHYAKQRSVQTETRTVTTMDQEQSQAMVQTMLHGALGSLAYVRGLFPSKAFDDRYYEMRDQVLPYEDFANANMPEDAEGLANPHTRLKILRRGRSRRVDTFLDWLENAAFNEIASGNLHAVEILINVNPKERAAVLETYSFTIQYDDRDNSSNAPIGVHMGKPMAIAPTVTSTNKAAQMLIRQVNELCVDMPELPKKRLMSMQLWYNNVPKQQFPDFIPGSSDSLLFPQAEGWGLRTNMLQLGSGSHQTTLNVSYMANLTDAKTSVLGSLYDLAFTTQVPRLMLQDAAEEERIPEYRSNTLNSEAGLAKLESSRRLLAALRQSTINAEMSLTQSSQVPQMRGNLSGMMRPENLVRGDTQSQPTHQDAGIDSATATPNTRYSSVAGGDGSSNGGITLLPHVWESVVKRRKELCKGARDLAAKVGALAANGDMVLCLCGHAKEEGSMVQCTICQTWQHLHCHGYSGAQDPRIPDEHFCYICLLSKSDSSTYIILQALAPKRRCIQLLNENGMRTKVDLASDLAVTPEEASALHAYFEQSNFLVASTNSKKPGFRATKQPLFVPVTGVAAHAEMFRTFYNPTTHVEKYYETPSTEMMLQATRQHRELVIANSTGMPKPATPQRVERRSRVMDTPGSGLDLPLSSIPFETPKLPARGSKRALNAGDDGNARKRTAAVADEGGYYKIMSQSLIDAGGESSPFSVHGASVKKSKR